MFDNEDHLRVTKIKTTDGVNPLYDDQNRPVKKVIHLPLTAKKLVEAQNALLPNQIKMEVRVIKAYQPEPVFAPQVDPAFEQMKQRIAELEAEVAKGKIIDLETIVPKKMGRPKKIQNEELL